MRQKSQSEVMKVQNSATTKGSAVNIMLPGTDPKPGYVQLQDGANNGSSHLNSLHQVTQNNDQSQQELDQDGGPGAIIKNE